MISPWKPKILLYSLCASNNFLVDTKVSSAANATWANSSLIPWASSDDRLKLLDKPTTCEFIWPAAAIIAVNIASGDFKALPKPSNTELSVLPNFWNWLDMELDASLADDSKPSKPLWAFFKSPSNPPILIFLLSSVPNSKSSLTSTISCLILACASSSNSASSETLKLVSWSCKDFNSACKLITSSWVKRATLLISNKEVLALSMLTLNDSSSLIYSLACLNSSIASSAIFSASALILSISNIPVIPVTLERDDKRPPVIPIELSIAFLSKISLFSPLFITSWKFEDLSSIALILPKRVSFSAISLMDWAWVFKASALSFFFSDVRFLAVPISCILEFDTCKEYSASSFKASIWLLCCFRFVKLISAFFCIDISSLESKVIPLVFWAKILLLTSSKVLVELVILFVATLPLVNSLTILWSDLKVFENSSLVLFNSALTPFKDTSNCLIAEFEFTIFFWSKFRKGLDFPSWSYLFCTSSRRDLIWSSSCFVGVAKVRVFYYKYYYL